MTITERIKTKPGYKLLLVAALILTAGHIEYRDQKIDHDLRTQRIQFEAALTSQEMRLRDYYASVGSPVPATMAKATAKSKRPKLAAAIAARESKGNPAATGDSGRSKGAWQVQGRYHGPVSADPDAQRAQHDRIMDELLDANAPMGAVERYNGQGRQAKHYARDIRREALLLEVVR